jgi:molybdate transport system substrate-binding protein
VHGVKVMASLAVKAAYLELVPAFERETGEKVETEWVGMAHLLKRMQGGELADAVIGSAALIETLVNDGRLDPASRVELAKCGVGAAVRAGGSKPQLGSVEALKRSLREAKSIVYSSGPSGVYLAELFERLGIAGDIRATQAPPGELVGERVARGEFELCFQQLAELAQVEGIDYAGPLPAEVQLITVFSGAIHKKSGNAKGARRWLRHLASAEATLRRHGLEPVQMRA